MTIRKTNLLFVFTDEQSISTMRSYGNAIINTPNMDKLADQSVVFEHAYVTQPVCTPSRASLLTGLYPHVHGCIANNIPLDMELPCLPEMGDFSDYRTGYFGKWHLGDEVFPQHGFRKWVSYEDSYRMGYSNGRDQKIHSSYHHYLVEQGFKPDKIAKDGFEFFSRDYCARLPEEHGKPAYTAREVTRFIRENEDNPFIAYVNFLEPHMPYFGPRDEQYDPDKVVLPANFGHMLSEEHPLKTRLFHQAYLEYGHSGLSLQTEDDWRKMIAHYWGLVSLLLYPQYLEQRLLEAIKSADRHEAQERLHLFLKQIFAEYRSSTEYELIMARLVSSVIRCFVESGGSLDISGQSQPWLERLYRLHSRKEVEELLFQSMLAPMIEQLEKVNERRFQSISGCVLRLIQERLETDITLETCAELLNYHPTYLGRVFKRETGKSFSEHLAECRLQTARKWLLETEMTLAEIAEKLHYHDASNFSRSFKKTVGMNPGKYRQLYR